MLRFVLRVRDLVHGTILFTEREQKIINHPFFQRLRQIRQNDVAFYVYPSINTSRFEHLLGTCRVAGMMAENLTKGGEKWEKYFRVLRKQTGIASPEEFIELCRLYALLHDVGHFPLSHLFERAVTKYVESRKPKVNEAEFIREWSGQSGFQKLHEAFGALLIERLTRDISLPGSLQGALERLMTEKNIPRTDPLSVVKAIVDSEVDADRIDFVRRDGILAGGEYGNFDVRRLCDSVFMEQDRWGWRIGYSEKAITSLEALLLDRYRSYAWIQFHHRVVAMKTLTRFLIVKALERGLITKEHFNPAELYEFALRDDVWLWNVLRSMEPGDETTGMIQRAVFYREKKHVLNLWKNRPAYHALRRQVEQSAGVRKFNYEPDEAYKMELGNHLGVRALMFFVEFKPKEEKTVPLYSERDKKLTGKDLADEDVSMLVAGLEKIWKGEPQEFIFLVGNDVTERAEELKQKWVAFTAQWVERGGGRQLSFPLLK
ncbi:HD domain-containing protein [Candidatus Azambacteria bacterium]|nr:HD domain-containing protein [Candidatus Azambacteria bacterium]